MEKERFRLKHPEIYIILFFISVAVATVSFVYACGNMNKKEPGLYLINPSNDGDIKYFGDDFSLFVYLDGSSSEIDSKYKEITNIYNDRMAYFYASVDDEVNYTTFPSIARLNEKPNEEVLLGSTVIDFLKQGYEYTNQYENYSIFSAPLHAFWYQQFSLYTVERDNRDPLNNESSASYLATLSSYINSPSHIDLEFIGTDKAKIKVSDEFLKFREDNGITASLVSLNIIKNEVLMDKIRSELEDKGYTNGYIVSKNGSILEFKDADRQVYNLYTLNAQNKVEIYGNVKLEEKQNASSFYRRFDLDKEDISSSYIINKDGVNYYRSIYIDINKGYSNNVLLNSSLYVAGGSSVTTSLINNELEGFESLEEVKTYIKSVDIPNLKVAFNTTNEDKVVYISEYIKENVKLNEELDYNLNII